MLRACVKRLCVLSLYSQRVWGTNRSASTLSFGDSHTLQDALRAYNFKGTEKKNEKQYGTLFRFISRLNTYRTSAEASDVLQFEDIATEFLQKFSSGQYNNPDILCELLMALRYMKSSAPKLLPLILETASQQCTSMNPYHLSTIMSSLVKLLLPDSPCWEKSVLPPYMFPSLDTLISLCIQAEAHVLQNLRRPSYKAQAIATLSPEALPLVSKDISRSSKKHLYARLLLWSLARLRSTLPRHSALMNCGKDLAQALEGVVTLYNTEYGTNGDIVSLGRSTTFLDILQEGNALYMLVSSMANLSFPCPSTASCALFLTSLVPYDDSPLAKSDSMSINREVREEERTLQESLGIMPDNNVLSNLQDVGAFSRFVWSLGKILSTAEKGIQSDNIFIRAYSQMMGEEEVNVYSTLNKMKSNAAANIIREVERRYQKKHMMPSQIALIMDSLYESLLKDVPLTNPLYNLINRCSMTDQLIDKYVKGILYLRMKDWNGKETPTSSVAPNCHIQAKYPSVLLSTIASCAYWCSTLGERNLYSIALSNLFWFDMKTLITKEENWEKENFSLEDFKNITCALKQMPSCDALTSRSMASYILRRLEEKLLYVESKADTTRLATTFLALVDVIVTPLSFFGEASYDTTEEMVEQLRNFEALASRVFSSVVGNIQSMCGYEDAKMCLLTYSLLLWVNAVMQHDMHGLEVECLMEGKVEEIRQCYNILNTYIKKKIETLDSVGVINFATEARIWRLLGISTEMIFTLNEHALDLSAYEGIPSVIFAALSNSRINSFSMDLTRRAYMKKIIGDKRRALFAIQCIHQAVQEVDKETVWTVNHRCPNILSGVLLDLHEESHGREKVYVLHNDNTMRMIEGICSDDIFTENIKKKCFGISGTTASIIWMLRKSGKRIVHVGKEWQKRDEDISNLYYRND